MPLNNVFKGLITLKFNKLNTWYTLFLTNVDSVCMCTNRYHHNTNNS